MTMLGPYELGRVHNADCRDAMRQLPDGSVQCCVTSPPYWGLRKYDVPETVWDAGPAWPGGPPCEHWFAPEVLRGGSKGGQGRGGQLADRAAAQGTRERSSDSIGSFCRICGAWRGQLGLEPTPDLYVQHLVSIFREVRRVLRDDGTLWLNIGDCYHSGDRGGYRLDSHRWEKSPMQAARKDSGGSGIVGSPNRMPVDGLKDKDLVGTPWLLAFALRADGWFLRAEIIWHKTAPMPESVRDRPTRAHEQIFLLSKSGAYFYNGQEAKEPPSGTAHPRGGGLNPKATDTKQDHMGRRHAGFNKRWRCKQNASFAAACTETVPERNWRSVWSIGPEPNNAQHYAPFPREVARRCVVAGSRAGDVVLDPFAGTGTTVRVADGLGRRAIGFDLGEKYVDQANERSGEVRPSEAKEGQQIGLLPSPYGGTNGSPAAAANNAFGPNATVAPAASCSPTGTRIFDADKPAGAET